MSAAGVVLLFVLAQLLLPSIAARRVRDRVARYGSVKGTSVSAWPAIELLWGKAQSVTVSAGALTVAANQFASLLSEARQAHDLTVSADAVNLGISQLSRPLTVTDMRFTKRGSSVSASAILTQDRLDEALPAGFRVEPVASVGGQVEVLASGGLFGAEASIRAVVGASEGKLIAQPKGFPLAGLGTVTLFSDAHLKPRSVGVRVLGRQPLTYGLSLTGVLL